MIEIVENKLKLREYDVGETFIYDVDGKNRLLMIIATYISAERGLNFGMLDLLAGEVEVYNSTIDELIDNYPNLQRVDCDLAIK